MNKKQGSFYSKSLLSVTMAAVLLSGCNSSESDGEGLDPLLQEQTIITEENVQEVVQASLDGGSIDMATDTTAMLSVSGTSPSALTRYLSPSGVVNLAGKLGSLETGSRTTASARDLQQTVSQACTYGGSMSVSGTQTSFSAVFSSCNLDGSSVINGNMSLQTLTWDGYDEALGYSMDIRMTDSYGYLDMSGSFQAGYASDFYGNEKMKINNMTISLDSSIDGDTFQYAMHDLNALSDYISTPDHQILAGTMGFKTVIGGVTEQLAFGIDMDVTNSEYYNAIYPENGHITVSGAADSSVRVDFDDSEHDVVVTINGGSPVFSGTYAEFDFWLSGSAL